MGRGGSFCVRSAASPAAQRPYPPEVPDFAEGQCIGPPCRPSALLPHVFRFCGDSVRGFGSKALEGLTIGHFPGCKIKADAMLQVPAIGRA